MGKPRQYSTEERIYLIEVLRGLAITTRHFWVNIIGFIPGLRKLGSIPGLRKLMKPETVTYQWPEVERPISPRWRGRHRLNKREDGTVKCVACMCCATACPSECIHIVARERGDGVDEKEPALFEIDLFRCVYCGMCVEACPCNAILMDTQEMRFCEYSPDKFVIGKEKLLDW
ncbi:MAG TPA: NADH-quinone oxidoreductase subunit I [bacterium]|nr:NADH-quinone oxidoreductase subunit I [bacterium]